MIRRTLVRRFRLLKNDGTEIPTSCLEGKTLLVYFSAHWCPPCRQFTPALAKFYKEHKDKKNFEVIFASWDTDEAGFKAYHAEHPWPAIAYDDKTWVQRMQEEYDVTSIPTLLVISPDATLLTKCGRDMVLRDPEALEFPWKGAAATPEANRAAMMRNLRYVAMCVASILLLYYVTTPRASGFLSS